MKLPKSILALLFSFVLIFAQTPTSAFAIEPGSSKATTAKLVLPPTSDELDWDAYTSGVDYVADELIVAFNDWVDYEEAVGYLASAGFSDVSKIAWHDGGIKAVCAKVAADQSLKEAMHKAEQSDLVLYAELDAIAQADQWKGYFEKHPEHVRITFAEGVSQEEAIATVESFGWAFDTYCSENCAGGQGNGPSVVASLIEGMTLDDACAYVNGRQDIESIVSYGVAYAADPGDDDASSADYTTSQWALSRVNAQSAWDMVHVDGSVSVAVLDSGVYATPDLINNLDLANGWDAQNQSALGTPIASHGTEVAGVIAAQAGDDSGISGVSYNATIVPVNIARLESDGSLVADHCAMARGIDYVLNNSNITNLRVINISYTGYNAPSCATLQNAVNQAYSQGVSVVASAGNDSTDAVAYPSDLENVISVIATNPSNGRASFSNYGTAKDISAPGQTIVTVGTSTDYYQVVAKNGTSYAAPLVSGIIALMYAANDDLTPEQAEAIIEASAIDLGDAGFDAQFANGLVDAAAAVSAAQEFSEFKRLGGATALDTMGLIVDEAFLNDEDSSLNTGSDVVIVATMASYYDALTAAGLAGIEDCPVLMTEGSTLSSETSAAIARLGASKVYIAGGTSAISSTVESQLTSLSGVSEVERLAGANACATAVEVYNEGAREGAWGDTAIVCTIEGYYDALAASPYSFAKGAPVFLTGYDGLLDSGSLSAIQQGGFSKVIIMGGLAAVSATVESQLTSLSTNPYVSRMAGANAFETSALMASRCLADGMSMDGIGFTTLGSYFDGLCASALCGRAGAPLLYADGESTASAAAFLAANASGFSRGYILGGTSAVPERAVAELACAVS